jgi:trans-aconitate 2-methyltransferase
MTCDAWDPQQYGRFEAERSQPFYDLLGMVAPVPGGRVLDLGCGTGALTRTLHEQLGAAETVGIDSSPAMLEQAQAQAGGGLRFQAGDIGTLADVEGPVDVVFANAALQWVPDHERVLADWTALLGEGGQLAIQVPANVDHPSHRVIQELAEEAPYVDAGDGPPPPDPVFSVLRPERYAELLHELGFTEQHVRLQVYGHVLDSTAAVVEWTKGTSLTRMARHLPPERYEAFVDEYRRRLVAELGDRRPYFYAFKRILFRAAR